MALKEKFIGIVIIILGAIPFLFNLEMFSNLLSDYPTVSYLNPGEVIYQAIIIVLGIWLIFDSKQRVHMRR